jgi:hypothetical protein
MKNLLKIVKKKKNLVEEDQNIQNWKINGLILTDEGFINKKNPIGEEKFKIKCLIT